MTEKQYPTWVAEYIFTGNWKNGFENSFSCASTLSLFIFSIFAFMFIAWREKHTFKCTLCRILGGTHIQYLTNYGCSSAACQLPLYLFPLFSSCSWISELLLKNCQNNQLTFANRPSSLNLQPHMILHYKFPSTCPEAVMHHWMLRLLLRVSWFSCIVCGWISLCVIFSLSTFKKSNRLNPATWNHTICNEGSLSVTVARRCQQLELFERCYNYMKIPKCAMWRNDSNHQAPWFLALWLQ